MSAGDNDLQSALSIDSQQAQWRHGAADKQSTASTSDISSHRQGDFLYLLHRHVLAVCLKPHHCVYV